jgi:uncharacterized membrane protein
MKRISALASFLAVCVILALLLLTQVITFIVSSIIFAVSLVIFGGLSRGFRGRDVSSKEDKKDASEAAVSKKK